MVMRNRVKVSIGDKQSREKHGLALLATRSPRIPILANQLPHWPNSRQHRGEVITTTCHEIVLKLSCFCSCIDVLGVYVYIPSVRCEG